MGIRLVNPQPHVTGSLWFVIPGYLQSSMIPWLESLVKSDITEPTVRYLYRKSFQKTAMLDKCGRPIWARGDEGTITLFSFYTANGEWRVNDCGVHRNLQPLVQAFILESLAHFINHIEPKQPT